MDTTTAKRVIIGSLVATVVIAEARQIKADKGPTLAPPVGALLAGSVLVAAAGPAPDASASFALIVLVATLGSSIKDVASILDRLTSGDFGTSPGTSTSSPGLDALRASAKGSGTSTAYLSTISSGPPSPASSGKVPANIVPVVGPSGTIYVDQSLAPRLQLLLLAAHRDGVELAGGGYRSPEEQAQLRRQHCRNPDTDPASACHPPTAPVGRSQHERGLAIDFTEGGTTLSSSSAGFRWLKKHAAAYGLFNLPAEPWHWSTTGK